MVLGFNYVRIYKFKGWMFLHQDSFCGSLSRVQLVTWEEPILFSQISKNPVVIFCQWRSILANKQGVHIFAISPLTADHHPHHATPQFLGTLNAKRNKRMYLEAAVSERWQHSTKGRCNLQFPVNQHRSQLIFKDD